MKNFLNRLTAQRVSMNTWIWRSIYSAQVLIALFICSRLGDVTNLPMFRVTRLVYWKSHCGHLIWSSLDAYRVIRWIAFSRRVLSTRRLVSSVLSSRPAQRHHCDCWSQRHQFLSGPSSWADTKRLVLEVGISCIVVLWSTSGHRYYVSIWHHIPFI